MPNLSIPTTELASLHARVAAQDGPGIIVWCLEHGGLAEAADPYALRWISPDGATDIVVGPEHGAERQVIALGAAILER